MTLTTGFEKHTLVRFLLGIVFSIVIGTPAMATDAPTYIAGATTVNAEQIIALVGSTPGLVIIDSRKAEDFVQGAVEGALLLTDTDMTPEALARVVPDKKTPVLFYCNGLKCGRAGKAVGKAVEWGYTEIFYYALGMEEWQKLGLPLVVQKASE
jgi:rhodanese-related sulfurtransferase